MGSRRHPSRRRPHAGQREGLEGGFRAVVIVLAAQHVDVQGKPRGDGERTKHVRDIFTGEPADGFPAEAQIDARVRTPRQIDDRPRQRLVERRERRPESR